MKLNAYLAKSTAVAALGGLMFGFDTAVISGAIGTLRETYQLILLGPGSASHRTQYAAYAGGRQQFDAMSGLSRR